MSEQVSSVVYSSGNHIQAVVYRIWPENIHELLAEDVLGLQYVSAIYDGAAANSHPQIPPEKVAAYYRPGSSDRILAQVEDMQYGIDALGSQFWGMFAGTPGLPHEEDGHKFVDNQLISLLEVHPQEPASRSPHLPHLTEDKTPDYQFTQIITHPLMRRRGVASAMVHAALMAGELDPQAEVSVAVSREDAGTRSFVIDHLGLSHKRASSDRYRIGEAVVEDHYDSNSQLGIAGVRKVLERRKPWLSGALVVPMD